MIGGPAGPAGPIARSVEPLSAQEKRRLLAHLILQHTGEPKRFPASFAQQRLWFLDQVAPGNAFYNVDFAFRLTMPLQVDVLEHALNEIVRRHDSLRTTFHMIDGQPVQVVAPALALPLQVIDLSHLSDIEREAEAVRLASDEARRPFDLTRGPLIRTSLLRLGECDSVFLLTMHHIVCDGWSMHVFAGELTALYAAFAAGQPSPLPPLSIQYTDFAVWQRQWLQGPVLEEQLAFWKTQLMDVPVLRLLTDRPRPAVPTFEGAYHILTLPRELLDALKALSQAEGVTLFMTLLAAFKALLSRLTGQEDIVVGSPVANRNRTELEGLIGFFVNMLVMRTNLSGDPTFRELLARVREVTLRAYSHQDLPFEKLVEELHPERDLSFSPIFQVSFQLFEAPGASSDATDSGDQLLRVQRGTAGIDLALDACEAADGLSVRIEYSTDLFDRASIVRMAEHFRVLLEGVVGDPDTHVSKLPVLTEQERHQLLVEWNQTAIEFPHDACVHQLFEAQVARTPQAVAAVFGETRLTYQDLNRRANHLAHRLRRLGVGPECRVAICLERSLDMVAAVLGVLKAGGAYVPIGPRVPAGAPLVSAGRERGPRDGDHGAARGAGIRTQAADGPHGC